MDILKEENQSLKKTAFEYKKLSEESSRKLSKTKNENQELKLSI